jgi:hypothetical protein
VDAANRRITIDVVQFFTGEAANRAAEEDGSEEVPPPNDYWIRNTNPRLHTLSVTPGARITVNTLAALETDHATKGVPRTLTQLGTLIKSCCGLFWITVHDGRVTRIAEQFLP